MKTISYAKYMTLTTKPNKARMNQIYKEYEPEGIKDAIITAILHRAVLKFIENGKLSKPGDYEVTFRMKIPVMFWHKVHYTIRKL